MEITGREVTYNNLSDRTRRELALKYKDRIVEYNEEAIENEFMKEVELEAQKMFGQVVLTEIDYSLELSEYDFVKLSMAIEPEELMCNMNSLLYPYIRNGHVSLDFDVIESKVHVNLTYCDGLIDRSKLLEVLDDDVDYFLEKLSDLETYAYEVGYKLCTVNKEFEKFASKFFNENGYTFITEPVLTKF